MKRFGSDKIFKIPYFTITHVLNLIQTPTFHARIHKNAKPILLLGTKTQNNANCGGNDED